MGRSRVSASRARSDTNASTDLVVDGNSSKRLVGLARKNLEVNGSRRRRGRRRGDAAGYDAEMRRLRGDDAAKNAAKNAATTQRRPRTQRRRGDAADKNDSVTRRATSP